MAKTSTLNSMNTSHEKAVQAILYGQSCAKRLKLQLDHPMADGRSVSNYDLLNRLSIVFPVPSQSFLINQNRRIIYFLIYLQGILLLLLLLLLFPREATPRKERIIKRIQVRIRGTIHRIRTTTMGFFGGNMAKRLLNNLNTKGATIDVLTT